MIIDGKKISAEILTKIREEVFNLPVQPVLCDILVGNDPASELYVKIKAKTAETVGMGFITLRLPSGVNTKEIVLEINNAHNIKNLCGLIVQLPLPGAVDKQFVLNSIKSQLDVDCVGLRNSDAFYKGKSFLNPPTASAILKILENLPIELKNKKYLVVGRGELVGRPVNFLLTKKGYRVETADKSTKDLKAKLKNADVIISATGQAGLIFGNDLKSGCVVIDAGTSEQNGSIAGDVDFKSAKNTAGYITPVPGGVGPVTVACLLSNVLWVAKNKYLYD